MASSNVPNSKSPVRDRTLATVDDCIPHFKSLSVWSQVIRELVVIQGSPETSHFVGGNAQNASFIITRHCTCA